MPNYVNTGNPLAEAAMYGGQAGQSLANVLFQIPMQRAQMMRETAQMQQQRAYQQGLMALKQQGLDQQRDWHSQENDWHQQQVIENQRRDKDMNDWHTNELTSQDHWKQIAAQNAALMQSLAILREQREGQTAQYPRSLGNGLVFDPRSVQPAPVPQSQQTNAPWQPTPDLGASPRFWNPEANTWNAMGTTAAMSREGRGVPINYQGQPSQGLMPPSSPATGQNPGLPPGVMQVPRQPGEGLNGLETGGQFDANRMKAIGDYLSILASTNGLAQRIQQQDPNLMPALSNRVYGVQGQGQGQGQGLPVGTPPQAAIPWDQWLQNH